MNVEYSQQRRQCRRQRRRGCCRCVMDEQRAGRHAQHHVHSGVGLSEDVQRPSGEFREQVRASEEGFLRRGVYRLIATAFAQGRRHLTAAGKCRATYQSNTRVHCSGGVAGKARRAEPGLHRIHEAVSNTQPQGTKLAATEAKPRALRSSAGQNASEALEVLLLQ